jgi:hypothetical protein
MKRKIVIPLVSAAIFMICAAPTISFNIMAPAPVNIPNYIQSIAIIDRTIPVDQDLNKLERILTLEGREQDRLASQIAIDGLHEILRNNNRYDGVRTAVALKGSASGNAFPEALDWKTIESLCEEYKVNAIASLETFDSDFIITKGTRKKSNPEGTLLGGIEFYANGVANVKLGFRLYDPAEKAIIDEFHFNHTMTWETGGGSIQAALTAMLNRDMAVKDASYEAGVIYGQRITPSWYRVSRYYFRKSKGDPDLAAGARYMETNDWDAAIDALSAAFENGHRKTRGRAAHNLAVVNEILGNLDQAKEWASKAWGGYKEKKSREYGYILTRRINERKLLEQQMEE